MPKKKPKPLTKAELRIMQVLWEKRRATVADVVAAIAKPPLAYTTVLTMLRILEQKGVVAHTAEGRAHTYHPCIEHDDAAKSALGDVLSSFFSGSKTALAVRLMGEQKPSHDELESMKALIARYDEESK